MRRRYLLAVELAIALGGCVTGCNQAQPPGPTSPPHVTVSYPIQQQVTDYADYPGRTAAVDSLNVLARVSGYLQTIYFQEGAEIHRDDVLYQIDPRPYQDALDQAKAQVNLQQAQLRYLQAVYQRNLRLYSEEHAVDLETLQQSLSQRDVTRAQLAAAQASVEQAQLNLDWTRVRSPIDGRIGRTLITRGNLVVADQTLLTTVVSQDPMYAYFEMDEPTVQRVQQLIRAGKIDVSHIEGVQIDAGVAATIAGMLPSAPSLGTLPAASVTLATRIGPHWPVYLGLDIERGYPHTGYVDFVNNQVTASTGTWQVRGVFANPLPKVGPRLLTPGLFVRIRVPTGPPYQALLVIQDAVGTQQNLKYVYVVDPQNRVEQRTLQLGSQQNGLQVIAAGIRADDRVIISGLQHVHPGMPVTPRLVPMPTPAAQSPANASTNPKFEIRNPKQKEISRERIANRNWAALRLSDFGF
jgi:multidrug efflux system membrane fusion protein